MKRNSKLSVIIALICIVVMTMSLVGCTAKTDAPAADANVDPAVKEDNATTNTENTNEPAAEPVTIVYQTQSGEDVFTKVFAEYQKTHSNVELEVQVTDAGDYNTKLMSQISTNTLPDVSWYNAGSVVGTFDTGAFLDLTPYIDEAKYVDGTFAISKTADGKNTVFPAEMQIQGFLINTALFEELGLAIPETFDDLLNCAKVFKENGKVLFGNGSADAWDTWGWYHWFELYGYTDDVDAIYEDGTLTLSQSKAATAWYKLAELREAGGFSDTASTVTYEMAKTAFLAGDCGIITTSTDQLTGILGSDLDKSGDIEFWFGTKFEDSTFDQNTCVKSCGNGYCVSANIDQAKLDVLVDFFDYFYSQEGADICVQQGMILPVVGYEANVEVTPLVESIIELTTDNSRKSLLTVNDYSLAKVGGNVDIWLDSALYLGTITFGLIDGSITEADLPEYMAEYDSLVTKMLEDYQKLG